MLCCGIIVLLCFYALPFLSVGIVILDKPLKELREQFMQTSVGSDNICDLLGEDPYVQIDEETEKERGMSPISDGQ